MNLSPVTLRGRNVTLAPLSLEHLGGLCEVGLDPELWKITTTVITSRAEMESYIRTALDWQRAGTSLPFAIMENAGGKPVGSTRYANIDRENRRLEIGWTWVARPWQRTVVNTESKFLLLCHAFDTLGCLRVEFKTDSLNERSRRALLRIGAREEGTLRNHMITPSGRIRHSVYYSVISEEWPELKPKLAAMV